MTTAHRVTDRAAIAGRTQGSSIHVTQTRKFAARDCTSYLTMKDRKTFQKGFEEDINKKELKKQLLEETFIKIGKRSQKIGKYVY